MSNSTSKENVSYATQIQNLNKLNAREFEILRKLCNASNSLYNAILYISLEYLHKVFKAIYSFKSKCFITCL